MRIELLGHAPTQAAMWAYLKDMGWAKQQGGEWHSVSCNLSQLGPIVEHDADMVETKRVNGWHFNLRLYGDAAASAVAGKDQVDGNGDALPFWDRTNFKTQIESRMVRVQTLQAREAPGLPEGYLDSGHGVRVYGSEAVNNRKNVWA